MSPSFLTGIPENRVVFGGCPDCPYVYPPDQGAIFSFSFSPLLSSVSREVMGLGLKSYHSYGTTEALTRACTKLCFKSSKSCCCLLALHLCQALQQPVTKGWLCPVYIVGQGLCFLAKSAEWAVCSCYSF